MTKHPVSALCLLLTLFAASLASAGAALAETWPARPVKLIVGFAPGGPTDLFARLIAQSLSQQTGKNFFIENVPGAGGNVGAVRAAQSAPDGYTFLVTGGNITNNPYLFSHAGYDPLKDFDAVTLGSSTPVVLAVNPSVPAHTVKELVDLIRSQPGKYSFASPGTGTPPQARRFAVCACVKARPRTRAVRRRRAGGRGDGRRPYADLVRRAGAGAAADQERRLARARRTGKERAPTLPDVPTMAEAGFPEVVGATWTAVVAPAGTPKDIIAKLNSLIVAGLAQPDIKAKLAAMAYVGIGNSPQQCEAFFKSEMATWSKVIKDAGLHAE